MTMRLKVHGLGNVPTQGGALVIANHVHNSDPILILAASNRPILWMAKREVWSVPIVRWFASQAGAFPVERGTYDRGAIRTAIETINEGLLVGMFPEGTRSSTGGLREPFAGASLVALRADAPIIPCVIVGSSDLPFNGRKQRKRRRWYPKVEIRFGAAFKLNPRGRDGKRFTMSELTDAMMVEIARLLPDDMRGLYESVDRGTDSLAICRENIQFPGS